MRFWSPLSAPAGRMPGVTMRRFGPTIARTRGGLGGGADDAVDADVARLAQRAATRSATVCA